jgi:octaprenyl-diphosphate synthase
MAEKLSDITDCLCEEIKRFDQQIDSCFACEEYLLREMIDYWFESKGKRIRPILTLLVANMLGKSTDVTYRSAVVLELIHTASLIHDDVLDASPLRRGRRTINNMWGNNNAVLFGDYIYGKCMEFVLTPQDFALMPVYSRVAISLPKGELLQKSISDNGIYSEKAYFDIIYNKTASLLEASCEIGVLTCGNITRLQQMKEVGKNLGIAFQVKDDILDFSLNKTIGKPIGNDIREKKINLPMSYFLQQLDQKRCDDVLDFIMSDSKADDSIEQLIAEVHHSGSIKKAQAEVEHYSRRAIELIEQENESIYRTNLLSLIDFLTNRDK